MGIITLTTDFGLDDFHVPSIKGAVYSQLSEVTLVDISHQIMPFDLIQTAYILKNSYKDFPEGTIHIIGVDALPSPFVKPIAAEMNGHFFICNDNGILSLLDSEFIPDQLVEITINKYEEIRFLIKDIFVPVACHLARGGTLDLVGRKIAEYKKLTQPKPVEKSEDSSLSGMVIYIDNYGNAITNISKEQFRQFGKNRKFTLFARNVEFTEIVNKYTDILDAESEENRYHGKALAIFNSSDYLQISMYKSNLRTVGGASSLMGLDIGTNIRIVFS
ncbi:SAM-dependent chlorinase/fluorinase [Apibacter raozihei]|uniref:SAM hydrolase/SAM-dependent halogenase family protein n=1 Tax=Apibacter TaxID=1778601 RepID=UPI000FE3ACF8|nr:MULTISPECIES: SAM-dependent chlorinase/fluorinase [Apibacter]